MVIDTSPRLLTSLASAELGREISKNVFFTERFLDTSSYQVYCTEWLPPKEGGSPSQLPQH